MSANYYGTTPFMVTKGVIGQSKQCLVFALPSFESLDDKQKLDYIKNLKIELTIIEGKLINSMSSIEA